MNKSKRSYRRRKPIKKSIKSRKTNKRQRTKRNSRRTLRLIRNKRGGGMGWAPWVGATSIDTAHNSGETLTSLQQPFIRTGGCQLLSCMGDFQ